MPNASIYELSVLALRWKKKKGKKYGCRKREGEREREKVNTCALS